MIIMQLLRVLLFVIATGLLLACSEKREVENPNEQRTSKEVAENVEGANKTEEDEGARPDPADVGEDCVAFLRLTRTVSARQPNDQCPQCPPTDASQDVLRFQTYHEDNVSCSAENCEITITIHASFNPSKGGSIAGGLTGWIPLEQREMYARGETPGGEQIYKVKITYRRGEDGWQAVEFDRG